MNANELADEWEKKNPYWDEQELYAWGDEAATMLRTQQAEIEKLKDEVAEWKMSYENCHRMCSGYGMN